MNVQAGVGEVIAVCSRGTTTKKGRKLYTVAKFDYILM